MGYDGGGEGSGGYNTDVVRQGGTTMTISVWWWTCWTRRYTH